MKTRTHGHIAGAIAALATTLALSVGPAAFADETTTTDPGQTPVEVTGEVGVVLVHGQTDGSSCGTPEQIQVQVGTASYPNSAANVPWVGTLTLQQSFDDGQTWANYGPASSDHFIGTWMIGPGRINGTQYRATWTGGTDATTDPGYTVDFPATDSEVYVVACTGSTVDRSTLNADGSSKNTAPVKTATSYDNSHPIKVKVSKKRTSATSTTLAITLRPGAHANPSVIASTPVRIEVKTTKKVGKKKHAKTITKWKTTKTLHYPATKTATVTIHKPAKSIRIVTTGQTWNGASH